MNSRIRKAIRLAPGIGLTLFGSALVVATSGISGEWPDAWGREVIAKEGNAFSIAIDGVNGQEAQCGPVVTLGSATQVVQVRFGDGTLVYEARCSSGGNCLPLRIATSMTWADSSGENEDGEDCAGKVRTSNIHGIMDAGICAANTRVSTDGFDCEATVTGEYEITAQRADAAIVRLKYRQYERTDIKDPHSLGCGGTERRE